MPCCFGTPEDFSSGAAVFRQSESQATAIVQGLSLIGDHTATEFLINFISLAGFKLFSTHSS